MFKISPLLLLAPLALMATSTQAKPAKKSAPKLPASVAAIMPSQVLDIATYQIAPAPGAPKMLVHLWCAPRATPHEPNDTGKPLSRKAIRDGKPIGASPFVYDVFAPNGKGGWNYLNTFIREGDVMPDAPAVRYLNNMTKTGLVFQVHSSDRGGNGTTTLYTFRDADSSNHSMRELYTWPARSGSKGSEIGFGRDARGFVQLVRARKFYNFTKKRNEESRTVSSWDEDAGDWKEGITITGREKGAE